MKKKYAICEDVPADNQCYLTSGKKYEITEDPRRKSVFFITSDISTKKNDCLCAYKGCAHLDFGDWTIIEEEE